MSFPRALEPPPGTLALITSALLDHAVQTSRESPRRRVIQPFHKSDSDPLHRMLNAVQPDSYIRPHRHLDPPKAEAWILLRGSLVFFTFEDDGRLRECVRLAAQSPCFGVDLAPGIYHSFIALEPDTVIYEVKTGPYAATTDKTFAPWAPVEGAPEARDYMASLLSAFERKGGPAART